MDCDGLADESPEACAPLTLACGPQGQRPGEPLALGDDNASYVFDAVRPAVAWISGADVRYLELVPDAAPMTLYTEARLRTRLYALAGVRDGTVYFEFIDELDSDAERWGLGRLDADTGEADADWSAGFCNVNWVGAAALITDARLYCGWNVVNLGSGAATPMQEPVDARCLLLDGDTALCTDDSGVRRVDFATDTSERFAQVGASRLAPVRAGDRIYVYEESNNTVYWLAEAGGEATVFAKIMGAAVLDTMVADAENLYIAGARYPLDGSTPEPGVYLHELLGRDSDYLYTEGFRRFPLAAPLR